MPSFLLESPSIKSEYEGILSSISSQALVKAGADNSPTGLDNVTDSDKDRVFVAVVLFT